MLLSMALCHILPEAEGMYQGLVRKWESEEAANSILDMEKHDDHDKEGEDHEGEEHAGEEEEHHEGEEEHEGEELEGGAVEEEGHEEDHEEGEHEEHEEGEHDEHEGHGHEEEGVSHGFPVVYVLFVSGFMLMLALD